MLVISRVLVLKRFRLLVLHHCPLITILSWCHLCTDGYIYFMGNSSLVLCLMQRNEFVSTCGHVLHKFNYYYFSYGRELNAQHNGVQHKDIKWANEDAIVSQSKSKGNGCSDLSIQPCVTNARTHASTQISMKVNQN